MGIKELRFAAKKPVKTRLWRNDEWILGTGGGLGNTPGGVCGGEAKARGSGARRFFAALVSLFDDLSGYRQ
jgi:hypothetical protein